MKIMILNVLRLFKSIKKKNIKGLQIILKLFAV